METPTAKLPDLCMTSLSNITVFEPPGTGSQFLLCGSDGKGERYRVLEISYNDELDASPIIIENSTTFTSQSLRKWLNLKAGAGTLPMRLKAVAFMGTVQLLAKDWHLHFVTTRELCGEIADRQVYRCLSSVMIPIRSKAVSSDAEKYRSLFNAVDMSKDFYYSHTFDLTRTLQSNASNESNEVNSEFAWNWNSVQAALSKSCPAYWLTPVIVGYFEQTVVELSPFQFVVVTLLCRRSRMMAGTRYQRRGLTTSGGCHVANSVQTEIVISLGDRWSANTMFTALAVQRGSIPLFWGVDQDTIQQPKPVVRITKREPTLSTTRDHFCSLVAEYGHPVVILNLIRQTPGKHMEHILGEEFRSVVKSISDDEPFTKHLIYHEYDFLGQKKAGKDLTMELQALLEWDIQTIGFFLHDRVQPSRFRSSKQQSGVVRVNCIDCLDRTNFAQYCVVKTSIADQLYALGIRTQNGTIESPTSNISQHASAPDNSWEISFPKLASAIKDLFLRHGDRIANQYAGSGAMHKGEFSSTDDSKKSLSDLNLSIDLEELPSQPSTKPTKMFNKADIAESLDQVKDKMWSTFGKLKTNASNNNAITAIKRFYSNAVTDLSKNQSIQVFLGHFRPSTIGPEIWDFPGDTVFSEEATCNSNGIRLVNPWRRGPEITHSDSCISPHPQTLQTFKDEPLVDISFINESSVPKVSIETDDYII